MNGIFWFPDAVRRNPIVETWLQQQAGACGRLARTWFQRLRECGPDVREVMHDGCPTACVEGAAFAYVAVFRAHANVGFFHGAELSDPNGLLQGTGKRMRHVKMRPDVALDADALSALITAAYSDMQRRSEGEQIRRARRVRRRSLSPE